MLVDGIATDYCVKSTVLDTCRLGLEVIVLHDAVKVIKNYDKAINEMQSKGVMIAKIDDIVF